MSEKIIRDPVHDVIGFRMERGIDALLFGLLNAAEFQRLRRVRQLGMASLAYPGAEHSRYSHSLGVMETARRMIEQLGRSMRIDEEMEAVCLCAALLHDLGHGPFSHVFERISGMDHEALTVRIIEDPQSEVHRLLAEHERQLPARVVGLMKGEGGRSFYRDIYSSQLDADRLDYLLRDNLMTGARYGDYDLRWLLHALTVEEAGNVTGSRLAVTYKGLSAVEAYVQARYHMYRNVYFHKVVRSAEGMVKLALQRAKRLAVQGRLEWPPRESGVYKALLGQRLSGEEFVDLDDVSVMQCFKVWMAAEDGVLARLCRGLLERRLFKTIELTAVEDGGKLERVMAAAEAAVERGGGEAGYEMFYDEPAETTYETYRADDYGGAGEIMVQGVDGRLTAFGELSGLPGALHRQLMFRRLHVAEAWRGVVGEAIKDWLV
jgi:uncharacterized protein